MKKSNILITGATGFIGSHVAEALLNEQDYQLIVIVRDKGSYKNTDRMNKRGAILFKGQFYDGSLLEGIFKAHPIDCVIHLAAMRGGGLGTAKEYMLINVLGTENLLNFSLKHRVRRFIFCSSVGVHGTVPTNCPANVGSPLNGDNHYHRSKIQAEDKVCEFVRKGLDAYILRPTITYGPGHTGFPKILASLVRKRMLLLPSNDIKIHLLNVLAFSQLLIEMIKTESLNQRIYIVADAEPISLTELVNLIHFYYYKTEYPSWPKLPETLVRFLLKAFQFIQNEKWVTRMLLLSRNWYYDIHETLQAFRYVPVRTKDSFIKKLCD